MQIAVAPSSSGNNRVAGHDRRQHPRFAVGDAARLTRGSAPNDGSVTVQLVDVSRGGVGILCPVSVGLGQSVRLDLPGLIIFGEGRNCGRTKDGIYRVGIEITTIVARRNPHTGSACISNSFPAGDILALFQERREAFHRTTAFRLAVLVILISLLALVALKNAATGPRHPRRIAYVVTGEGTAGITFHNKRGLKELATVQLPWFHQFDADGDDRQFLYVSAQKKQAHGVIEASVYQDGHKIAVSGSEDPFGTASVGGVVQ